MMKPKQKVAPNSSAESNTENHQTVAAEPVNPLLQRLASGQRVSVSKKDMKALTSKNYEQLPEV